MRGVGDPEGVKEPPPAHPQTLEPQPELEEAVEGAASGCRLRAGLHRGASSWISGL